MRKTYNVQSSMFLYVRKVKIEKFENIDSWKVARELTVRIYEITKKENLEHRDYAKSN